MKYDSKPCKLLSARQLTGDVFDFVLEAPALAAMAQPGQFAQILVPGYGAQGGAADDVAPGFDKNGLGAIVNSSRGIICAWQKTGKNGADYQEAARAAAIAMRDDICRFIAIQ